MVYCQFLGAQTLESNKLKVSKDLTANLQYIDPVFNTKNIELLNLQSDVSADSLIGTVPIIPSLDLSIQPLKYMKDVKPAGYSGFVKSHIGHLTPLFVQGVYSYNLDNFFSVTLGGKYDNLNESVIHSKFIKKSDGFLNAKYYINKDLYTAISISHDNTSYGLFGFNDTPSGDLNESNDYLRTDLSVGIQSFNLTQSKFNFGLNLGLNLFSTLNNEVHEKLININSKFDLNFSKNFGLSLIPGIQYFNSNLNSINSFSSILQARFLNKTWSSELGISAIYVEEEFNLFPQINAQIQLSSNQKLHLLANQSIETLGIGSISKMNPYISPTQNKREIAYSQRVTASFSNVMSEKHDLVFDLEWNNSKNALNFFNSESTDKTFDISYIDFKTLVFGLTYNYTLIEEIVSFSFQSRYNHYYNNSAHLLHRPKFEINPYVVLSTRNRKLEFRTGIKLNSGQEIALIPYEKTRTGYRKNIDAEIKYKLARQIVVYFNGDNLLNDSYQVLNGYSQFGRNLSGGILVKF